MAKSNKRPYRAVRITKCNASKVQEDARQQRIVFGIDVAKKGMFAAVLDEGEAVLRTVKWNHPEETGELLGFLSELRAVATSVEIAMEPSGVYGDALRCTLLDAGFDVYRVSPKKTHDMAEIHDGVPSSHDGKSAAIVAGLHFRGASDPWPMDSVRLRRLAAAFRMLEVLVKEFGRHRNRLEGYTARHWPEATYELELGSATLLTLLAEYGGPAAVAAGPDGARVMMLRVGGSKLDPAKVDRLIASAARTVGVPQVDEERELVQFVAREALRLRAEKRKAQRRLEALVVQEGSTEQMAPVVGKTTAAVVAVGIGDPRQFESPRAMVKAAGLNLRERSSGQKKSGLHITKRGSGVARMYLWMAALRMIKSDPVVRAWYIKKVKRDGGRSKAKAVVAVMRKLVLALWHVGRGAEFDSSLLFDTRRLNVVP